MKTFVKSALALGISTAITLSTANAATYEVVDKGAATQFKFTYSQQENNAGNTAISGTEGYNFPVQFQYFDEEDYDAIVTYINNSHELVHGLTDVEDETSLRAGNPTANDLAWVVRFLGSRNTSTARLYFQVVGDTVVMLNDGTTTEEVAIFDQKFEGTDTYTRSTIDYVNGITNQGWLYGNASAPYLPTDFVDSEDNNVTFWTREFDTRGYFSPDGGQTIIPLMPTEATYGGESAILDISDTNIAVGYASTSIAENATNFITDETGGCKDPEVTKNIPEEICIRNYRTKAVSLDLSVDNGDSSIYNSEAHLWQLDANGQLSSTALGHLVTPHEDDPREFKSFAQAVNDNGVAVGFAHGWVDENRTDIRNGEPRRYYAVVYKNGTVQDFTEDHSELFSQRAYDINNEGIAVGYTSKYINGDLRTKFFYVDTNADNMEMVLPTDFFVGSSSVATAINEAGKVVGHGEVETHNDSSNNPRRTNGFIFDKNTDTFTNLNDLLACESPYTIIEARHINDNDEISASAIIKQQRRDAKGELMVDESGEPITEDVIRAVTLKPTNGEIEDCSEVEEKIEREGAGFGLASLMLLSLVQLRRRFFK